METSNLAKRGPNGTMTLVDGDPKIESHLLTRCSEGCNWLPGRKEGMSDIRIITSAKCNCTRILLPRFSLSKAVHKQALFFD